MCKTSSTARGMTALAIALAWNVLVATMFATSEGALAQTQALAQAVDHQAQDILPGGAAYGTPMAPMEDAVTAPGPGPGPGPGYGMPGYNMAGYGMADYDYGYGTDDYDADVDGDDGDDVDGAFAPAPDGTAPSESAIPTEADDVSAADTAAYIDRGSLASIVGAVMHLGMFLVA